MDEACCAETTACSSDDGCEATANQLNACPPGAAACRIDAKAGAPPANARLAELATCRTTGCAVACNTCGGLVDAFGAACDACVQTSCCDLAVACAGDQNCAKVYACIAGCSTSPDCTAQCLQGPLRDDAVIAFQNCVQGACYDACKIGQDWECVSKASWGPPPTKPNLLLDFKVVDFLSRKVVPNAIVKPCSAYLGTCSESATTDATGVAKLVIPVDEFANWSGYFRIQADGFREQLTGSTKPLNRDDFTTAYMVKEADLAILLATLNTTLDDDKALVFATALDCNGLNAPGIRFELSSKDPGILPTYFPGPGGDSTKTNKFGTVAFGNVPVNNPLVGISMYLGETLVGEIFAPIEPGKMTAFALFPKI